MKKYLVIIVIAFSSLFVSATPVNDWKRETEKAEFIHRSVKLITDLMVRDIYSPPVASRTYAYISIAGYEAAVAYHPEYRSLADQLKGLKIPRPVSEMELSYTLSAVKAILTVGKKMVISESRVDTFYSLISNEFRKSGIPQRIFDASVQHGENIATAVLQWAASDNYQQTRSFARFAVNYDAATWKPTPPAYMKAVEPHWNKIRTFVIDSAQQFKPLPPTPFAVEKESRFYQEALAVYEAVKKLTPEQKNIADFWDCNPFRMNINGHVMYASKKISPGGHWMNIAKVACEKASAGVMQSLEAYALLSITNADAFISCWDEKYRSNVIRPETYINQYIDPAWLPLLQTPPFPEYTSGHSVLSTASAVILTGLFGSNFSFVDSTETEFGLPSRSFLSFEQAAEEAAISRFYGGIHYMPAINNGTMEGRKLGEYVWNKIRTRNGTHPVSGQLTSVIE